MAVASSIHASALAAVGALGSAADAEQRLKAASPMMWGEIDGVGSRDEFGKFALMSMKARAGASGMREFANHLIVALAEKSESRESACICALTHLSQALSADGNVEEEHEAGVIIDACIAYYREASHEVDWYPFFQMLEDTPNLPLAPRLRVIIALLHQGEEGHHQTISIRKAVTHLFGDATSEYPGGDHEAVARKLVSSFDIKRWANWLPELKFEENDKGPFASACRIFIRCCFAMGKPLFALFVDIRGESRNECANLYLLKAIDLCQVCELEDVRKIAVKKGRPLPNALFDDYLEPNFLDREANAKDVTESWIHRQIEANSGSGLHGPDGNVFRFPFGEKP